MMGRIQDSLGIKISLDRVWLYSSRCLYPNWLSLEFFTKGWKFFFREELQNLVVLTAIGVAYDCVFGTMSLFNIAYRVFGSICVRRFLAGGICSSTKSMEGQNVIITGANVGIGKEAAKDLLERGARVIMGCRDIKRGDVARQELMKISKKVELRKLDLSDLSSVREFARGIHSDKLKIHVLINNAGVMTGGPYSQTVDGFELHMGTNHLGHFLLTRLLLPMLKHSQPARIVNVASLSHLGSNLDLSNFMSEDKYKIKEVYGDSKLANILFTRQLATILKGTHTSVFSLHPGVVNTEIARHIIPAWVSKLLLPLLLKTAAEGAQTTLHCATEARQHRDMYFSDCSVGWPKAAATDDFLAEQLWKISEELVKPKLSKL